jgi:alkylhydroperoxidase family enzyme
MFWRGMLIAHISTEEYPMPHIQLPEGLQGIRSAMAFRPETAKPLNELAEALLHAPNSLPQADRELIATRLRRYFAQFWMEAL